MPRLKATQASLFSLLPVNHNITTSVVPDHLLLRPGLVKIIITKIQGDEVKKFELPVQWTTHEAAALIYEIRGTMWQLGEDGAPIHLEEITAICEDFCKREIHS